MRVVTACTAGAGQPCAGLRIVVADDEAPIRLVVAAAFRARGAAVVEARTGAEALAAIQRGAPDLLVTDFQMPDMSGAELCRAVRADPRFASTPIIMLTARAHRLDTGTNGPVGFDMLLSKPFSVRDLLANAIMLLEQRRAGEPPASRPGGMAA